MSLYPSLEDMKVDHMVRAQIQATASAPQMSSFPPTQNYGAPSAPPALGAVYPSLGDFMGLEFTQELIALNMPEYLQVATVGPSAVSQTGSNMIAPLSGGSVALSKSFVTQAVRQFVLCKDKDGKVGLRLRAVSGGLFVCLVSKGSPAALAGMRFGDQVLEINDEAMAGKSMDKAHKMLKEAPVNGIRVTVRDRPFERTVTLHKDSVGSVGFHFKDGNIVGLVKDSSAARNGLLTDHQLCEVNGQNVVGLKDKEIVRLIEAADRVVTVTVLPNQIYKHMISKMSFNLIKGSMDHTPAV